MAYDLKDFPILLTPKERQVCECLMVGMSNKQIAERLGNTLGTIKNYNKHIFDMLGSDNRVHCAARLVKFRDTGE